MNNFFLFYKNIEFVRNLIYSCSRRYSVQQMAINSDTSTLGLYSGVSIRGVGQGSGKMMVGDNLIKQCDVGIHIADNTAPAVRYDMNKMFLSIHDVSILQRQCCGLFLLCWCVCRVGSTTKYCQQHFSWR